MKEVGPIIMKYEYNGTLHEWLGVTLTEIGCQKHLAATPLF